MSKQEFPTIDPAALAQVSGGTTVTTSSASSDQILTALNGILTSLQGMTQPNASSGGFNQQEMMMLMMIMQQRNQQQVVTGNPFAGWGQSPIYYY